MTLPFDPKAPPEEPPRGCDRLTWTLAYQTWCDHQPDTDGRCLATLCRERAQPWPCPAYHLALAGFVGSVGWWAGLDGDRPPTRWPANVFAPGLTDA